MFSQSEAAAVLLAGVGALWLAVEQETEGRLKTALGRILAGRQPLAHFTRHRDVVTSHALSFTNDHFEIERDALANAPDLDHGTSPLSNRRKPAAPLYPRRFNGGSLASSSKETSMPFSKPASWPTAFCACAAPSAPIRSWSRFSYPPTLLRDSCYLLDHGN